jgi:hypothetical protein
MEIKSTHMSLFSIPTLLKNRSQYELDAARHRPFYIPARIRVNIKDYENPRCTFLKTYTVHFKHTN